MTRGKLLIAIAVALCAHSLSAATVELPMPRPDATGVAGAPRLFWNLASENIFPEGDFEDGAGGWGGQVVTATAERPALHGTNYLRLNPFGTGSLQTSCRTTLPNTSDKLIWSFGVAGSGAEARIYSTNGPIINGKVAPTLLVTEPFTNYGANFGWGVYSVDISGFAGQTIILAINFGFTDGVSREIDDVRVTIQPRDVAFDVYLDNVLLGRTTNNWWQLQDLSEGHSYSWRVDPIDGGVRTRGPVWRFTTPFGWPADDIRVVTMPASVCPAKPVPVEAIVRDLLGLRTTSQSGVRFTAFAENVAAPQIVISEIDVGDRDGIEFINGSTNTLSLSGSSVQILAPSNAIPVQTIRFPPGSTLAPGQMFTIMEGGQNVWPEMRMTNVNWGDTGILQAGVVLRNVGSNVIDCAFIDLMPETNNYRRVHLSAVSELDWRSDPITNVTAGQTVQRFRNRDFNNREDWTNGVGSFGAVNTGLTTPFDLGFGLWNLAWTNATKVVSGTGVTTTIEFPSAAKNVQIVARQSSAVFGISEPFDVVEPEFCLSLLGPIEIREDAGSVDLRIELGNAAASDVVVNLSSSNPLVVALPATVTIPAGASEAFVAAQVIDNDLLEGRKTVSLQAAAPSYTPAKLNASAMDDETATLRIVGPASVLEGDGSVFTIETTKAPAMDAPITLITEPQIRTTEMYLPAGSTSTTFTILENVRLTGDANVRVRAEFQDWEPGLADVLVIDKQPKVLQLAYDGPAIAEGSSGVAVVSLLVAAGVDIEVTFTSAKPEVLQVTNRTIIKNFESTAAVPFRVLANDLPGGQQGINVTAMAPTFASATVTIPALMYPPGPSLQIATEADGSIEITFNAESGSRYLVVDSEFVYGHDGDSIVPLIANGVGRFTVMPGSQAHFFSIVRVLE